MITIPASNEALFMHGNSQLLKKQVNAAYFYSDSQRTSHLNSMFILRPFYHLHLTSMQIRKQIQGISFCETAAFR